MRRYAPALQTNRSEDGYLLVWVMFLLVVFTIGLSVAVSRTAKEIQRDRELETMNRGKQYIRAVQLYYKKFHSFPPNANALVNTNEIRFLRKKYIDPTTGKDDWKPIRFGEAKTQTPGFFGQPIAGAGSAGGTVLAGVGPSGSSGIGGSPMGSGIGGSSPGGSSLFSSPSTPDSGTSGTPGAGTPGTGGATGATGSSGSSSAFGASNQTFGGAGIVGFSPASTKTSILIYRKKQRFNEWEFVYDPLTDTRLQSGHTGAVGQPASSTTSPVGSSNIGFGPGNGAGTGSSGGIGASPSPPPGTGTTPGPPETPVPPQTPAPSPQ